MIENTTINVWISSWSSGIHRLICRKHRSAFHKRQKCNIINEIEETEGPRTPHEPGSTVEEGDLADTFRHYFYGS